MADFLSTLFSGGAEQEAADKNRALLAQYGPQAQDYLKTGYDTGTGAINNAIGAYAPLGDLAKGYNAGGSMWLNSLGINGQAGTTAAQNAFTNNPGYTGAVNAGLDIINRRRAGQGMNASGNADIDALTFGQNLQNQQYGAWQQQLQQAGNTGVGLVGTQAAGTANQYDALANLAQTYAGNQTGVAGNVLSGNVNANNLEAAGQAAGAKNLLGAGLSLATLAAGGAGVGGLATTLGAGLTGVGASGMGSALGNWGVGSMPATGAGAPSDFMSNMYARSQGIPV